MSQPNNNNGDDHKYKKIFVGGLAWRVTTDDLRSFFQQRYGEVLDANVVSETLPGGNLKSKGYGFVTFRDAESANRACQPPYPEIEGRQTNINLAYLRAKNNPNHSNQTGALHQAGPSHQYQNGYQMAWHPYQNGWCYQGAWNQYPMFNANQHFPQGYWDSHYGAYHHMYGVSQYNYSSTVNCYQTNTVGSAGVSQPPNGPRFVDVTCPNPGAVSAADVVSNFNSEELDTETSSDVGQQKGKDQEGDINGQDSGIKQDVKDQEGEINGQENGINKDVKDQEGEINGQYNGIKQDVTDEQEKIVSGEDDDTKHGVDHEEKIQHMEVGLTTKKKR